MTASIPSFSGARALVTGGAGFIGSNLAIALAETLSSLTGARWEFAPFSAERKAQEPGDFYSDISKIRRLLEWSPRTPLREGLEKTIAFYRIYNAHYW